MSGADPDAAIRLAAFSWLSQVTNLGENPVSWSQLVGEFSFHEQRVTLIGQKGIWKPSQMELPISITTAPPRPGRPQPPYDDHITDDGLLRYRYEGTNPRDYRNVWLRECWRRQIPLIYLHGISKGSYFASWPVVIAEDHPSELSVLVEILDPHRIRPDLSIEVADEAERRLMARLTRQRLHQATFRHQVIRAYDSSCAMCRLRHTELLDAAHILPFADGGPSIVANGLSLCKIHHAAYDHDIIGVRPDFRIELREDILDEIDGPMLRHGLQQLHGESISLPRAKTNRPAGEFLEQRWARFDLRPS